MGGLVLLDEDEYRKLLNAAGQDSAPPDAIVVEGVPADQVRRLLGFLTDSGIEAENPHDEMATSELRVTDGINTWSIDDPEGPIGRVRSAPDHELISALEYDYALPGRAAGPLSTSMEWEEIKHRLTGIDPLDDDNDAAAPAGSKLK